MRILGPIVLILLLVVFDTRQRFSLRRALAPQLVRNDHARNIPQSLKELAEEFLSCLLVSVALHQNVQHVTILIYSHISVVF